MCYLYVLRINVVLSALQREVSHISCMLKWCGTKTTQQPLNPVICSMPISANLYVGFRAHGYVRQQIRADAALRLCWCWCTLPAAIWSGTNQGGTVVLNGRDLCETVTHAYRSTRPCIHGILSSARYYRQMASGLINEIREYRSGHSAAMVANVGRCEFSCCNRLNQCDVDALETSWCDCLAQWIDLVAASYGCDN